MRAAVVREPGKPPIYGDFDDPVPSEGEVRVAVTASALTNFTKVRAAGKHFSFVATPPFIVGIDGVGTLDDGRRVYFLFPRAPYGGLAQQTVVRRDRCIELADELDDVTAAALADPGMAAWVALESRAKLARGETVLVNGATGTAGAVAVQIAKYLGAKRVVATGRNRDALRSLLTLGADEVLALEDLSEARDVDIVLDYLWGPSAEQLIAAAGANRGMSQVRFVQIGTASAPALTLPGANLRSSGIQLMGSGVGAVPIEEIVSVLVRLMRAAPEARFRVETTPMRLERIGEVWASSSNTPRTVFTMHG